MAAFAPVDKPPLDAEPPPSVEFESKLALAFDCTRTTCAAKTVGIKPEEMYCVPVDLFAVTGQP